MKKSLLALLFALLLALAFGGQARTEEVAPDEPQLGDFFLDETIALFEFDTAALRTALNAPVISHSIGLIFDAVKSNQRISEAHDIVERIAGLPFLGKGYFALLLSDNQARPIVAFQVEGSADESLERLFEGLVFYPTRKPTGETVVRTLTTDRTAIHFVAYKNIVFVSQDGAALRIFAKAFPVPKGNKFTASRIWQSAIADSPNAVVRGALDFRNFTRRMPALGLVYPMFGVQDAIGVTYSLSANGASFAENIKLVAAAPITSPLTELAGKGEIRADDSAIPDSAIAAARLNLDKGAIFEWFVNMFPQLGGRNNRIVNQIYSFFKDVLGFPDPLEFFALFDNRIEAFLDMPRGGLIPEFVISLDLTDANRAGVMLAAFEQQMNLPSGECEGVKFAYIPRKWLRMDFWGVCWGIVGNKLIVTSSASSALSALRRAKVSPLLKTDLYSNAMKPFVQSRGVEVFVDPAVLSMCANVLRNISRSESRPLIPTIGIDPQLDAVCAVVTGEERSFTISSRGLVTPLLFLASAIALEHYDRLAYSLMPQRVNDVKFRSAHKMMQVFIAKYHRVPFDIMELAAEPDFEPSVWLEQGAPIEDGFSAELYEKHGLFHIIAGVDIDDDNLKNCAVMITRNVNILGMITWFTKLGYFTFKVEDLPTINMLNELNAALGTNYRIEGNKVLGPE